MKKLLTAISTYRTALMGIAILGVMIGHCKTDWPVSIFSRTVGLLCYSVFTGGFLFLSGFGLFFSMSKNPNVDDFYRKRVKRLLVPWLCLAVPYFLLMDIVQAGKWNAFLWHVSTLSFWKSGNYSGMWYISVIVMLYLLYPWYHRFVFRGGTYRNGMVLLTISGIAFVEYLLFTIWPDLYGRLEIAMSISIFFIGVYVGYLSALRNLFSYALIIESGGVILLNLILVIFTLLNNHIFILYNIASVFAWAWLFSSIHNTKIGNSSIRVVEWFGRYTLELYMIHLFLYYIMKNVLLPGVSNNMLFLIAVVVALAVCKPIHDAIDKLIKAI